MAEDAGIQALAVHGRTRADAYKGEAEYDTIAAIKDAINIPVIANGDIDSPEKAAYVLKQTQADGLMIGRAAQGNPWIFRQVLHFLETGQSLSAPALSEIKQVLIAHLENLYDFYGDYTGVRMARKHIAWYSKGLRNGNAFRQEMNLLEDPAQQMRFTQAFFEELEHQQDCYAA
jgi:tRNA-dihydrouridine synthase B